MDLDVKVAWLWKGQWPWEVVHYKPTNLKPCKHGQRSRPLLCPQIRGLSPIRGEVEEEESPPCVWMCMSDKHTLNMTVANAQKFVC